MWHCLRDWRFWRGVRDGRGLEVSDAALQAWAGSSQAFAGFAGAFAVIWAAEVARKTFGASLERKKAEAAFDLARRAVEFAAQTSSIYSSIRSPFGYSGEGESREKSLGELPEESKSLNKIFVMRERINFHKEFWETGIKLQWELEAVFGASYAKAVREILSKRMTLILAWDQLHDSDYIYPLDDSTKKSLQEARNKVWQDYSEGDKFKAELNEHQEYIVNGLKSFVHVESKVVFNETPRLSTGWWNTPVR
jgi:hypothetical protein